MMHYKRRICAKRGDDVSGRNRDYGRAEVRLHHGMEKSEGVVIVALCPSCAIDLAALVAEWAEVI